MGDDQITALINHIDRSLDRTIGPIQTSISKLFDKFDDFSEKMSPIPTRVNNLEGSMAGFKQCQKDCDDKMSKMRKETNDNIKAAGAASSKEARQAILIKILFVVSSTLFAAVTYFLTKFFDKIF